jgi:hypothetical protein
MGKCREKRKKPNSRLRKQKAKWRDNHTNETEFLETEDNVKKQAGRAEV